MIRHELTFINLLMQSLIRKLSRIIDAGKKKVVGESTAFNKFRELDTKGRGSNEDSGLNTIHQNTIT
jgi:hypothetical protein